MSEIQNIATTEIVAGNNDRTKFDQTSLMELADSIGEHGLAQPITVRWLPEIDCYQIVAGERRYRAIRLLGWETTPAIVRELDDEAASAIMLAENTSRADLDPIDEAQAYRKRMDRFGWSVADCAERAGVSTARVRSRLQLLDLPDDLQHLVRSGQFPLGHAAMLSKLDVNRQRLAVRKYNTSPMTKWEFRTLVSGLYEAQVQEQTDLLFDTSAYYQEMERAEAETRLLSYVPVGQAPPCDPGPRNQVAQYAMERYIIELLSAGQQVAAHAVGEVLKMTVLAKGYATLQPDESPLRTWLARGSV